MLNVPHEFVADDPRFSELFDHPRDVDDPVVAATLIGEYLDARVRASVDLQRRQVVLLSGGVDSIVLLAALVRAFGPEPLRAVTVSGPTGGVDTDAARAVADHLSVEHVSVTLDPVDLIARTRAAIATLECDELWEVGAAVVLRAAVDAFGGPSPDLQVWTGDSADAIFSIGGRWPLHASLSMDDLSSAQQTRWEALLSSERLVPDFHARVIDDEVWNAYGTREAAAIAVRMHGDALFGGDKPKEALRTLAEQLGIPSEYARRPKAPMQTSSGLFDGLLAAARASVASLPNADEYHDPQVEPIEYNLVRLWLHTLDVRLAQANPGR